MNATSIATSFSYLLIGSGRVARHLAHYFQLSNITYESWDRSQDPHALARKVSKATHVLVAISDSALEGFFRQHVAGHDVTAVHFSGALNIEGMIAAHPLMTFGADLYDLKSYQQIHFTLTGASELRGALPGLQNPFSILPAEQKALYHAFCVVGGNFVSLLMGEMFRGLGELHIPADAGKVYLEKVFENTFKNPQSAPTGPLIRKDVPTVQKNLQALEATNLKPLYEAFVKTYWPEYPGK
jgi:predicted short-subunit dehydrogenase-like oxidoreductase (DUF2520 family)